MEYKICRLHFDKQSGKSYEVTTDRNVELPDDATSITLYDDEPEAKLTYLRPIIKLDIL